MRLCCCTNCSCACVLLLEWETGRPAHGCSCLSRLSLVEWLVHIKARRPPPSSKTQQLRRLLTTIISINTASTPCTPDFVSCLVYCLRFEHIFGTFVLYNPSLFACKCKLCIQTRLGRLVNPLWISTLPETSKN